MWKRQKVQAVLHETSLTVIVKGWHVAGRCTREDSQMARKKIARNAPCPCGSGKKYQHCCLDKDFDWLEDDDGTLYKAIPLSDEMMELLEEQHEAFVEKHGREPGPDDLLFDGMPPLEHVEHEMIQAMKEAGVDPAIIYAAEETGLLVTEENQGLLSEQELAEWEAAIDEYHAEHGEFDEPPEFPVGTIALYGPDDKVTTKIAAGVIVAEDAEIIIERWVGTGVWGNPKVQQEIEDFFHRHGVKSVAVSEGNLGCPHEEGEDFPVGGDCPFCPFWKGKQGSGAGGDFFGEN